MLTGELLTAGEWTGSAEGGDPPRVPEAVRSLMQWRVVIDTFGERWAGHCASFDVKGTTVTLVNALIDTSPTMRGVLVSRTVTLIPALVLVGHAVTVAPLVEGYGPNVKAD